MSDLDIERAQRAAVVAEARSWIGTPYHHQADVKGHGVDCGMLLVRIFVDLGLVPPFDPRPYATDWMLHRNEETYLGFVFDRTSEVAEPEPGDVVVMRIGRTYSHGGIVTDWPKKTIIHAYQKSRRVVEGRLDDGSALAQVPRRAFSFWARG